MNAKARMGAVASAALLSLSVSTAPALASSPHDVIRADLVPSQPTFGTVNGLVPGGAPWVLDRGEVRVRDDGRMDVRLEGFQIPRPDGTQDNPVASITAVVYCAGTAVATSGPQALSVPGGDARFRVEGLALPETCDAPSVVISPTAAVGRAYIAFTPTA